MKCYDLDNTHTYGSEYKNDCRLFLTNYIHFDISIKAKSKKHGNNYGKNKNHNLNNYITIIYNTS